LKTEGGQGVGIQAKPIVLDYVSLPSGKPDAPIKIGASGKINRLSIVGGNDDELKPYSFVTKIDGDRLVVSMPPKEVNGDGKMNVDVAIFSWHENTVEFDWAVTDQDPGLRQALMDCVLDLELQGGNQESLFLRKPDLPPLPGLQDTDIRAAKKRGARNQIYSIPVAWVIKNEKFEQTRRIFNLCKFSIEKGNESLPFTSADQGGHTLTTEDNLLEARISNQRKWELYINWKSIPPSDLEYNNARKLCSGLEIQIRAIQSRGNNGSGFPQLTQMQNEFKRVNDWLSEADKSRSRERMLSGSRIRATVGLTVGGREFLLPELHSPGLDPSE
jgi:hypothetical protein